MSSSGPARIVSREEAMAIAKNNPKAKVMQYEYDKPADSLNAAEAMVGLQWIRKKYLFLRSKDPEMSDMDIQRIILESAYGEETMAIRFANAYPLLFLRLTQRQTTNESISLFEDMIRAKLYVDTGLSNYKEVTEHIAEKIMEKGSRKATEDEIAENKVKHHTWKDPLGETTIVRNLNPLPLSRKDQ